MDAEIFFPYCGGYWAERVIELVDERENFWLKLLEYGDTEDECRRNWNVYCDFKFAPIIDRLALGETLDDIRKALSIPPATNETRQFVEELEAELGAHPELPPVSSIDPFISFRGETFLDDVSFSGRVLIRADFQNAVFVEKADFRNVRFLGLTHFSGAKFQGTTSSASGVASFSGSKFYNTVYFEDVQFPYGVGFKDVIYNSVALFQGAKFMAKDDRAGSPYGNVNFAQSKFQAEADFRGANFGIASAFEGVEFQDFARFDAAQFQSSTIFNNARFQGTTSFRNTAFYKPPRFFETELHEDVDFSRVDWGTAENSYKRSRRRADPPEEVEKDAGDAVRAWDRLALIMSQQEKSHERHDFFRLKMRALHQRDGRSFSSFVNRLFDVTSDYGWGIRRAFSWWFAHIAFGALILGASAEVGRAWIGHSHWLIVRDSVLVSLANAHAFLGLTSEGGYLRDARRDLENSAGSHVDWVFDAVGTFQAFLGPILLFLVLLTLRNRFRLG